MGTAAWNNHWAFAQRAGSFEKQSMCGSAAMPNDSFSAPCLMILMSRCGKSYCYPHHLPQPFFLPLAIPKQIKTQQQQPGSEQGLGRLGWQQGRVFSTLGKVQSSGGIQVSHSSHGFPTAPMGFPRAPQGKFPAVDPGTAKGGCSAQL